jgi:hypothetical protein
MLIAQLPLHSQLPLPSQSVVPSTHADDTTHRPLMQTPVLPGPVVHTVSSTTFMLEQPMPEQLSIVHGLPSSQLVSAPPTQTPPEQRSFVVQGFPSEQRIPLTIPNAQSPDDGSQSGARQTFDVVQRGGPAVQVAPSQKSPVVQPSPSSQPIASALGSCRQPSRGAQTSRVQALPSSQPMGTHSPPQHSWPSGHSRVMRRQVSPSQAAV